MSVNFCTTCGSLLCVLDCLLPCNLSLGMTPFLLLDSELLVGPDSVLSWHRLGASSTLAHTVVIMNVELNGLDLGQSSPSWVPCHPNTLVLVWMSQGIGPEEGRPGGGVGLCLPPPCQVWLKATLSRDLSDLSWPSPGLFSHSLGSGWEKQEESLRVRAFWASKMIPDSFNRHQRLFFGALWLKSGLFLLAPRSLYLSPRSIPGTMPSLQLLFLSFFFFFPQLESLVFSTMKKM